MTVRILLGDVREKLAELPDESVHCVVTSPPYFGLRDYGTASWEGGDPSCDHLGPPMRTNNKPTNGNGTFHGGTQRANEPMGKACNKCGATRTDKQIGLEPTPAEFVAVMVEVFREVRRVLRKDGTLWLNLGDSYNAYNGGAGPGSKLSKTQTEERPQLETGYGLRFKGLKPKDLLGIPWRVAFALQADGWYLRQDIIWSKPNPMPESVTDRCTKAHEYLFLLSKSARYHYDAEAIAEAMSGEPHAPGNKSSGRLGHNGMTDNAVHQSDRVWGLDGKRNRRSVWTVATQPFSDWSETVRRERVAPDAPVDGKKRTTSPDCPVHGDRCQSVSTDSDGVHAAVPVPHSGGRIDLFQAQVVGSVPTDPHLGAATAEQSSDSPDQSHSPSAKPHNKRSRKTDRAPETTLSCTPCDGTPRHTDGTSASPELSGSAGRMLASNTGQAATADRPSAETASHIAGNSTFGLSDCTCEWYIEKTSKTSHFATFPPDLIEPCIKAGCPKGGVVLDPFGGAGTTGLVADRLQRGAILIELNPEYAALAKDRLEGDAPLFADVAL